MGKTVNAGERIVWLAGRLGGMQAVADRLGISKRYLQLIKAGDRVAKPQRQRINRLFRYESYMDRREQIPAYDIPDIPEKAWSRGMAGVRPDMYYAWYAQFEGLFPTDGGQRYKASLSGDGRQKAEEDEDVETWIQPITVTIPVLDTKVTDFRLLSGRQIQDTWEELVEEAEKQLRSDHPDLLDLQFKGIFRHFRGHRRGVPVLATNRR